MDSKPDDSTKKSRRTKVVLAVLAVVVLACAASGHALYGLALGYRSRDARSNLEILWTRVLTYSVQALPPERRTPGETHQGLPPSVGPSPNGAPGKRALIWVDEPGSVWQRIGFRPANATFFVYQIVSDRQAGTLVLRAEGDVDGDGVRGRYEIRARTNSFGVPERDPGVFAENDGE